MRLGSSNDLYDDIYILGIGHSLIVFTLFPSTLFPLELTTNLKITLNLRQIENILRL